MLLSITGSIAAPVNLRVSLLANSSLVLLTWNTSEKSYNNYVQFVVIIEPSPKFGICSTGQCIFDSEYATIPGLELNTNYTVSVMASACYQRSHMVTTHMVIKQKGLF